jgi:uncharacterized protein (TIGR00730 family)
MSPVIVSVFGSSKPTLGSEPYEEARYVGRLLAEAGFAVMTGGYGGTMAAISQGASEAGGHVIGVTSNRIEQFRPTPPNEWVAEEIRHETQRDRLIHIVMNNDGMIALPGGIGTLSEVSLAWSMLQTGEIAERPLVLLGNIWRETIQVYAKAETIRQRDMDLLYLANGPVTAVGYVKQQLTDRLEK